MVELPWWTFSPSPFTIVFWVGASLWITRILVRKGLKFRNAFAKAINTLGLIVLIGDLTWVTASGLRFGPSFPESVNQLVLCGFRDIAGIIFCFFIVVETFQKKELQWTFQTSLAFLANAIFIFAWFMASPSPAYTDWTYAFRYNYATSIIIGSFFTSHIIGKMLTALTLQTLF